MRPRVLCILWPGRLDLGLANPYIMKPIHSIKGGIVSEKDPELSSVRHTKISFKGGVIELCTLKGGWLLLVINRDGQESLSMEVSADTIWDIAEQGVAGIRRPICKQGKVGTIHAQSDATADGMIILGFSAAWQSSATIEVNAQDFFNAAFHMKTGQTMDGTWSDKETEAP